MHFCHFRGFCLVADRASEAIPLEVNGAMGNGRSSPDVIRATSYGTSSDYLTSRIARDRPDILNRMKAGEFKSVRQAAKEGLSLYIDVQISH